VIEVLVGALRGIASCATHCGCCEMHRRIADDVLTLSQSFQERFELVIVCKHCGCLADPQDHICGEE
jgi:hypothetical protein